MLNPYDTSTDPGGSIISPATQNGVVGIRPSTGLWSRSGVVPISETQDTLGSLTQTVSDAALLLQTGAGHDPDDPRTADSPVNPDFLSGLRTTALQGARIGVSGKNANYVAARIALTALGATVVPITVPNLPTQGSILNREFRRDLSKYLSTLPASAPIKSFDEAYDYLKAHPEEGREVRRQPHRPVVDVPARAPGRARRVPAGARHRDRELEDVPRQPPQPGCGAG